MYTFLFQQDGVGYVIRGENSSCVESQSHVLIISNYIDVLVEFVCRSVADSATYSVLNYLYPHHCILANNIY